MAGRTLENNQVGRLALRKQPGRKASPKKNNQVGRLAILKNDQVGRPVLENCQVRRIALGKQPGWLEASPSETTRMESQDYWSWSPVIRK